jgi:hypothetical protein
MEHDHLVGVARQRGFRRVSLEIGTMDCLRTGTVVVHGRKFHAVRSFRRLQAESEQHVHHAASRLAPIAVAYRRPQRQVRMVP